MTPLALIPTPYKVLALAALIAAIWGHGWLKGATSVQAKWDKADLAEAKAVIKRQGRQIAINDTAVTVYYERTKTIAKTAEAITREIPVYVPSYLPDLPGSFRVLHDAAAKNAAPSVDPDAQDVSPQDVASTVAENYAACHATAAQLVSLQDWIANTIKEDAQ